MDRNRKILRSLGNIQEDANGPLCPSPELARELANMVSGASDHDAAILQAAALFLDGDYQGLRHHLGLDS